MKDRITAIGWLTIGKAVALAVAAWGLGTLDRAAARDRGAVLEAAIATVTETELREHAGLLADDTLEGREAGTRGGRTAARYLEKQMKTGRLQGAGDHDSYTQRFGAGYQNVLGILPGTDAQLRDELIVIGAHYDHVGYGSRRNSNGPIGYIHNGADDNASGVAALLEAIDALHRVDWQPRRSILFAFWDGEEINLLGSRHWVRQPTKPLKQVRLAINADMVGRMTNHRLEVAGTRTAAGLRKLLSSPRLPEQLRLDFTWEYKENSDHWPFFEAGIPSLLVHTGLHEDYHRPSDDIEKLNVAGIRQASAYLVDALCRLADADELPPFRAASRSESAWMRIRTEAPLPPIAPRLGLRWNWTPAGADSAKPHMKIAETTPDMAAQRAGLRAGDVIVSIDGRPIVTEELLPAVVLQAPQQVSLEIIRGEQSPETVDVQLDGEPTALGLSWRADSGNPGAVLVTRVVPYSPAARAGLAVHDRIYAAEGEPFADQQVLLERVRQLVDSSVKTLVLEVETAGRIRTVAVDLRLPDEDDGDASL